MANKLLTPQEMKAYVDATWKKCQAEAWQEPRQWQGLTDAEIFASLKATFGDDVKLTPGFRAFARAIEAKLKEKNA